MDNKTNAINKPAPSTIAKKKKNRADFMFKQK